MTEATKGNDVRAACEAAATDIYNTHLSFTVLVQNSPAWADIIEHYLSPVVEARVQAAAVEMRERCAKVSDDEYALDLNTPCDEGHREFHKKYGTVEVSEAIRALPIPTNAYDAALLRARLEELDRIDFIQYDLGEAFSDWVEREWAELKRQLADLTQPAPERKEK